MGGKGTQSPPQTPGRGYNPLQPPSLFTIHFSLFIINSPSSGVLGDIPPNRGLGGQSPPEKPLNYSLFTLTSFSGGLGGTKSPSSFSVRKYLWPLWAAGGIRKKQAAFPCLPLFLTHPPPIKVIWGLRPQTPGRGHNPLRPPIE